MNIRTSINVSYAKQRNSFRWADWVYTVWGKDHWRSEGIRSLLWNMVNWILITNADNQTLTAKAINKIVYKYDDPLSLIRNKFQETKFRQIK